MGGPFDLPREYRRRQNCVGAAARQRRSHQGVPRRARQGVPQDIGVDCRGELDVRALNTTSGISPMCLPRITGCRYRIVRPQMLASRILALPQRSTSRTRRRRFIQFATVVVGRGPARRRRCWRRRRPCWRRPSRRDHPTASGRGRASLLEAPEAVAPPAPAPDIPSSRPPVAQTAEYRSEPTGVLDGGVFFALSTVPAPRRVASTFRRIHYFKPRRPQLTAARPCPRGAGACAASRGAVPARRRRCIEFSAVSEPAPV